MKRSFTSIVTFVTLACGIAALATGIAGLLASMTLGMVPPVSEISLIIAGIFFWVVGIYLSRKPPPE